MRIDLSVLGEGQFVEIKDVNKMSWKQQKALTSAFKEDSIEAQLDVAELLAVSLVKGGYLLDVEDKPVSFPLTAESVGDVPASVVEKVAEAFAQAKSAQIPKQ